MSTSQTGTRAARMAPADRRRAIVDAVVPLLLERGSAPSTRDIAAAAGIAEGTIFRVFPDMGALWRAVAEQTLDGERELASLRAATADATDLPAAVLAAVEHLLARSRRVMAIMGVMRSVWMQCSPEERHRRMEAGPPAFVHEANEAVMRGLVDLFEPHRAALAVDPPTAARVLRALVLGARQPGFGVPRSHEAEHGAELSAEVLAAVVLHGLARPAPTPAPREDPPCSPVS